VRADIVTQAIQLNKKPLPHIVVGTPGRLVYHLENTRGFSLRAVRYLVRSLLLVSQSPFVLHFFFFFFLLCCFSFHFVRCVRVQVLDEADRLLNMEFEREINQILTLVPRERRTYARSFSFSSAIPFALSAPLDRLGVGVPMGSRARAGTCSRRR
jgi:ATP-dependent RNA helicase DDX47/RRP3